MRNKNQKVMKEMHSPNRGRENWIDLNKRRRAWGGVMQQGWQISSFDDICSEESRYAASFCHPLKLHCTLLEALSTMTGGPAQHAVADHSFSRVLHFLQLCTLAQNGWQFSRSQPEMLKCFVRTSPNNTVRAQNRVLRLMAWKWLPILKLCQTSPKVCLHSNTFWIIAGFLS